MVICGTTFHTLMRAYAIVKNKSRCTFDTLFFTDTINTIVEFVADTFTTRYNIPCIEAFETLSSFIALFTSAIGMAFLYCLAQGSVINKSHVF